MSALPAWRATAATELRLHRRHGVWTLVAVSAVAYSAVVVAAPAGWRGDVVAWLLGLVPTAWAAQALWADTAAIAAFAIAAAAATTAATLAVLVPRMLRGPEGT